MSQKRSSEVLNRKKNKESVGDIEEGQDEEDDGSNSHENKVVDESTTQHNHLSVFEKNEARCLDSFKLDCIVNILCF